MDTKIKIALGLGAAVAGYALYSAGKSSVKPAAKKTTTTQPPIGAPKPTPDAPEPKLPGMEGEPPEPEPEVEPVVITTRDFETSDNAQLGAPVTGQIVDNGDGTFTVLFVHATGVSGFDHKTIDGAELRLDSTVNKPSEWTCAANYDAAFDAWVCVAGMVAGDTVARGFLDKEGGPAPWWVTWDGAQYSLIKMADLLAEPVEINKFDTLQGALQTAVGTVFEAVAV